MSNYKHYTLDDWIQCINDKLEYFDVLDGNEMRDLANFLSNAKQQKVGKWIKTYEPNDAEPFILWECSKCQNAERGRRSKYCSNCGAKMEVEDEKSNNSMR